MLTQANLPKFLQDDRAFNDKKQQSVTEAFLALEEQWTPLEPHCLNLNLLEPERKNTDLSACTLDEIMDFSGHTLDTSPMSMTRRHTQPALLANFEPVNLPIYDWEREDSFCTQVTPPK